MKYPLSGELEPDQRDGRKIEGHGLDAIVRKCGLTLAATHDAEHRLVIALIVLCNTPTNVTATEYEHKGSEIFEALQFQENSFVATPAA